MRAIVTCGPGFEPIDEVRRLSNFSTGELGTLLCEALAAAGFQTLCLRGTGSTHPAPRGGEVIAFGTTADLAAQLERLAGLPCALLLHAAALGDYRVAEIRDAKGALATGAKIATRQGGLTLRLEPAPKLLPRLRSWYPATRIIGWKFQIDGTPAEALALARAQIHACQTDACVLNGRAWGTGLAFVTPDAVREFPDRAALASFLAHLPASPPSPAQQVEKR